MQSAFFFFPSSTSPLRLAPPTQRVRERVQLACFTASAFSLNSSRRTINSFGEVLRARGGSLNQQLRKGALRGALIWDFHFESPGQPALYTRLRSFGPIWLVFPFRSPPQGPAR